MRYKSWWIISFLFTLVYTLSARESHAKPLNEDGLAPKALKDVLVIAGNFSIDGKLLNIAEYDLERRE